MLLHIVLAAVHPDLHPVPGDHQRRSEELARERHPPERPICRRRLGLAAAAGAKYALHPALGRQQRSPDDQGDSAAHRHGRSSCIRSSGASASSNSCTGRIRSRGRADGSACDRGRAGALRAITVDRIEVEPDPDRADRLDVAMTGSAAPASRPPSISPSAARPEPCRFRFSMPRLSAQGAGPRHPAHTPERPTRLAISVAADFPPVRLLAETLLTGQPDLPAAAPAVPGACSTSPPAQLGRRRTFLATHGEPRSDQPGGRCAWHASGRLSRSRQLATSPCSRSPVGRVYHKRRRADDEVVIA